MNVPALCWTRCRCVGGQAPGPLILAAAGSWRLRQPDARLETLPGLDGQPPAGFGCWHGRLRTCGGSESAVLVIAPDPADPGADPSPWPPQQLLVLAPRIEGLAAAAELELGLDPRRCRLIQPERLRARLLEFLKFRVLAAQGAFFAGLEAGAAPGGADAMAAEAAAMAAFRRWLQPLWPEALDLDDADLRRTLEQARQLYID